MRRYFLILLLCGIFFLLPLHLYIIGGDNGIGIQGAVFRYQISGYGNSFITITSDVMYIMNGVYSGRTALSIILWVLGTLLLAATIIFGFTFVGDNREDFYWQISLGLFSTCACYLISCIAQYGFFFSGSAGISLPVGILIIILWVVILNIYTKKNIQF